MFARIGKWSIAAKVLPIAFSLAVVKFGLHYANWEFISLNPLFSGLLAAAVFLLGFLLSGVLSDYKESEKLPGELAIGLESMIDQMTMIHLSKKASPAENCLRYLHELRDVILIWLYREDSFETVMKKVGDMNPIASELEPHMPPQFVARLLQEQSALRRTLTRIEVIRETSFVKSAYALAEIMVFLLIFGLLLARIDPFYESLFFVVIISFLVIYLLMLIRDLDNPFEYSRNGPQGSDEVSLAPLVELGKRHESVG